MTPGLDILNTGRGHAEVTFDHQDPIELERGKRIIEDMLRRGYLLFIQGDDGAVVRVESFDGERGRYIIGDCALYAVLSRWHRFLRLWRRLPLKVPSRQPTRLNGADGLEGEGRGANDRRACHGHGEERGRLSR